MALQDDCGGGGERGLQDKEDPEVAERHHFILLPQTNTPHLLMTRLMTGV